VHAEFLVDIHYDLRFGAVALQIIIYSRDHVEEMTSKMQELDR